MKHERQKADVDSQASKLDQLDQPGSIDVVGAKEGKIGLMQSARFTDSHRLMASIVML